MAFAPFNDVPKDVGVGSTKIFKPQNFGSPRIVNATLRSWLKGDLSRFCRGKLSVEYCENQRGSCHIQEFLLQIHLFGDISFVTLICSEKIEQEQILHLES